MKRGARVDITREAMCLPLSHVTRLCFPKRRTPQQGMKTLRKLWQSASLNSELTLFVWLAALQGVEKLNELVSEAMREAHAKVRGPLPFFVGA